MLSMNFLSIKERIFNLFAIDYRTLGVFRVLIAIIVVVDIFLRCRDFSAFFTEQGIIPRNYAINWFSGNSTYSLYFINGGEIFSALLVILTLFFAVLLFFGYKTKLSTIMMFVMIHSLQMRCTILNSSGDDLLRVLLFWSIFLPLGKCFSVDAYLLSQNQQKNPDNIDDIKKHDLKKHDLNFVVQSTSNAEEQTKPEHQEQDHQEQDHQDVHFPKESTTVSNFFTFAILQQALFVYWVGAFLKNNPIWTEKFSAIEWTLHLGHFVTPIGTWFVNSMTSYLNPLTQFVLYLELYAPLVMMVPIAQKYLRTTFMFLLIGMHLNFVLFMALGFFPFISITSLLLFFPSEGWNWLEKKEWFQNNFVTRFWTYLRNKFIPLHDYLNVYLSWASHRHHVSKIGTAIAIFAFGIVLHTNLNVIVPKSIPDNNLIVKRIRWGSGLYQNWTMFAPYPLKFTLWPKFVGTTKSGQEIDVFLSNHTFYGASVAFVDKRPENILGNYTNYRWRKFHGNIRQDKYKYFRGNYAKYECQRYNELHSDDKITKISLKMGLQWSPVDGTSNRIGDIDMGNYTCR